MLFRHPLIITKRPASSFNWLAAVAIVIILAQSHLSSSSSSLAAATAKRMTSTTSSSTKATTASASPSSLSKHLRDKDRLEELEDLCSRLAKRLRQAEGGTRPRCVFSDLDGTLLHFGGNLFAIGYEVVGEKVPGKDFQPPVPPLVHRPDPAKPPRYVTLRYQPDGTERVCIELPSLTSGPGYISVRTIELVGQIREAGCDFVLITGARSSTYLMRRRTGLPVVDYEVIEGGGRILRDPKCEMCELSDPGDGDAWDQAWKDEIGPGRTTLWTLYEDLKAKGWVVDGRDYLTSFRVDTSKGEQGPSEWLALKERLGLLGLASSFNLGKADIYPHNSGKAQAVKRLMKRLHLEGNDCVVLFDDDNDLGMAALCARGKRIAVSITHESVRQLVITDPGVETVNRPGILGTEEALERVLAALKR